MPGRQFNGNEYRYGFQNQEEDQEIWNGAVSFKYRMEDPRLGRFFSRDPLAANFPWNSPYAFSENRVIDGIELEGLEVILLNEKNDPEAYQAALKDKDKDSNDGVIDVYAHAEYRGIKVGNAFSGTKHKGWVSNAKEFDAALKKLSPEYKAARRENKEIVVILHACRTGRETTHGPNNEPLPSIGKVASTVPGVTIIAPDERQLIGVGKDGP
jgi:RHS repeat-associated protein